MIMITSVVIVATLGVVNVGGFGEVWRGHISSPEYRYTHKESFFLILFNRIISIHNSFTLDLVTRTTFWNTTSGVYCIWLCHIGFSQSCVQRLVSLPSLRAAKRLMSIFFSRCGLYYDIQLWHRNHIVRIQLKKKLLINMIN